MQRLYTEEGLSIPDIPWDDYPRPQLRRQQWLCLNGEWDFSAPGFPKRKICVPFCPESLLSGIQNAPEPGTEMVYEKSFTIPEEWADNRILLHFGAVSRECSVLINGKLVCRHDQAYLPFSADITEMLRTGENRIRISVVNDLSSQYPYGKQTHKRGGMWYTPVSGIWQTVWLEPVPKHGIESIDIQTGTDYADIRIEGCIEGRIDFEGKQISVKQGKARIEVENPILWCPENPHLYSFTVTCGEDRVESYFALRTLSIQEQDGVPVGRWG